MFTSCCVLPIYEIKFEKVCQSGCMIEDFKRDSKAEGESCLKVFICMEQKFILAADCM